MNEFRATSLIAKSFAGGFDPKALTDGAVAETAREAVVEEIEVTILEFHDFSAIDTNEVIVVGMVDEVRVVGGLAVPEFNSMNEVGFHQEGQGAVNSGAGSFGAGGAEALKKFVRREVLVGSEDDFEDFVPLGSLSESLFSDEIIQSFTNISVHCSNTLGILG